MKKLFIRIIQLTTIFTVVALQSNAQVPVMEAENSNAKTENAEPIRNLMQFLGRWEAEVTLVQDGKEFKLNYWVEGKKEAEGKVLSMEEGFTNTELGTMHGANLAGWDPYDAKIKWFSADNLGTTHEHIGDWIAPHHLQLVHNGMRNGIVYVETIEFLFKKDPAAIIFQLTGLMNGVETTKANGVFNRKSAASPQQKKPVSAPAKKSNPVKK